MIRIVSNQIRTKIVIARNEDEFNGVITSAYTEKQLDILDMIEDSLGCPESNGVELTLTTVR